LRGCLNSRFERGDSRISRGLRRLNRQDFRCVIAELDGDQFLELCE
jgi:hypothetical protein